MKRPALIAIAVAGGVALLGIGLAWFVANRTDETAEDRRQCHEAVGDLSENTESVGMKQDLLRPEPLPGWDVVKVAKRQDGTWVFVDDGTGAPRGIRYEGTFEVNDDALGFAFDMGTTDPSIAEGQAQRRERRVMTGSRAWIEDAKYDDRLECPIPGYAHSVLNGFENTIGATPFLDRVAKGGRDWLAPNINPGVSVLAKVVSTEVVDGVTMTTYEQHPVEKYEQVRTRFTLDQDGQLRWAEAVDTTTGKVLYHRTARPDPGHPPIKDPTGEPIISMSP